MTMHAEVVLSDVHTPDSKKNGGGDYQCRALRTTAARRFFCTLKEPTADRPTHHLSVFPWGSGLRPS
jgi:hypothetical protein